MHHCGVSLTARSIEPSLHPPPPPLSVPLSRQHGSTQQHQQQASGTCQRSHFLFVRTAVLKVMVSTQQEVTATSDRMRNVPFLVVCAPPFPYYYTTTVFWLS